MFNGDFYILVCGARDWADYDMIYDVLHDINANCVSNQMQLHVVTGAQRKSVEIGRRSPLADDPPEYEYVGADWIAIEVCLDLQIPFHGYPAQWNLARERYGKNWRRAGIDRNAWQLREHRHHLAEGHAFHDNISASKGTKDMVNRMQKAEVPVTIHAHR